MAEIWKESGLYSLTRKYGRICTLATYSEMVVEGRENIPSDSPVLFVANHSNTLMDALVVLAAYDAPTAFGARADIFRNPRLAAFLRFLRILPLSRERDGLREVAKNLAIFDEIVDCMGHGVPFCIFPEGTHRTKHSLLPLKKGAFRVAVQAANDLGKTVCIVPAGIEYEDYFEYGRSCHVNFGKPLEVHGDTDINELRKQTCEALKGLFTYLPDDENYDAAWAEIEASRAHKAGLGEKMAAILGAFLLIPEFLAAWPLLFVAWLLVRRLKDKAWSNTMRLLALMFLLPFWSVIFASIVGACLGWLWAIPALIYPYVAYSHFYRNINRLKDAFGK